MTSYFRALDTFVAEIGGVPHGVVKGAVLPEGDLVVQHALANGSLLFAPLDTSEDEKAPVKSAPAKADAKAAAAPRPVKGGKF